MQSTSQARHIVTAAQKPVISPHRARLSLPRTLDEQITLLRAARVQLMATRTVYALIALFRTTVQG